eukprot:11193125-Alexandrium_andersonii.AAC.1
MPPTTSSSRPSRRTPTRSSQRCAPPRACPRSTTDALWFRARGNWLAQRAASPTRPRTRRKI